MELEEFITKTLTSIAKGIKSANKDNDLKFSIKPSGAKAKGDGAIEFDIAVTLSKKKGQKGGIGISILSVGLKGQKESGISDETVSRIKFNVTPDKIIG